MGLALAISGSVLELAGIDSVGYRGSFWQLFTEATLVSPLLPKPWHANPVHSPKNFFVIKRILKVAWPVICSQKYFWVLEKPTGGEPLLAAQEVNVSLVFTGTKIWNYCYGKGSIRLDKDTETYKTNDWHQWLFISMLLFQAALGIHILFKKEHNKVRIGVKWLEIFFQTGQGGISALFYRHSLRDVSASPLPGQLPRAPGLCELSRVILLCLFVPSKYLNSTIHVFKSIS